jgi:hypothetical protein
VEIRGGGLLDVFWAAWRDRRACTWNGWGEGDWEKWAAESASWCGGMEADRPPPSPFAVGVLNPCPSLVTRSGARHAP